MPWTGSPPVDGTPGSAGIGTCGVPADPIVPGSVEETRDLAVGTWIACGDADLVDSDDPASVGIELTDDGRYVEVLEQADGTLLRAGGPGSEGTWSVLDLTDMNGPGSYQINFDRIEGGTVATPVTFFASPAFMRLDAMGTPLDYLRWTGEPPVDDPTAAGGESTATATAATSEPTEAASKPPGVLPRTGSPLVPLAVVALVLGAAGVAALVLVRRDPPRHDPRRV